MQSTKQESALMNEQSLTFQDNTVHSVQHSNKASQHVVVSKDLSMRSMLAEAIGSRVTTASTPIKPSTTTSAGT